MVRKSSKQEKSDLSTAELVRIMESGAKCGVRVLKFRGLELEFGKQTEPVNLPDLSNTHTASNTPVAEMTDQEHTKQAQNSLEQQELEAREAQLEELKITDPVLFEELVNDGELEEDDDDESGDADE